MHKSLNSGEETPVKQTPVPSGFFFYQEESHLFNGTSSLQFRDVLTPLQRAPSPVPIGRHPSSSPAADDRGPTSCPCGCACLDVSHQWSHTPRDLCVWFLLIFKKKKKKF